mgnify:CR=1 FL=1
MGQDFYEKYPSARQVFDQASQWLSLDMKALCFEKNDRLNLTEYTQAALVTTCLAMEKVVEECGLHPDITAGIKPGEYCAIAVSGGMSVKDAIVTVRKKRNPYGTGSSGRTGKHGGSYGNGNREDRRSACRHCRRKYCQLQLSRPDRDHRA